MGSRTKDTGVEEMIDVFIINLFLKIGIFFL